ncbi:hypothetical protein M0J40_RS10280 [Providencia rettgeri]|nr:hypothetical protein [Providencia rettgeri]ELR5124556.1 hypothetical protein [Providencia rettgeri]ELR5245246.1 hypothetical protein [Providencia rettgeri]ELS4582747.1 hypothetical protein [Providencia rettgeri]
MNNLLSQPLTFTLNREPVFYIRQNEMLSPFIQISLTANKEFCVPLYTGFEFDDASIRAIQAQGVDSLADALQGDLSVLNQLGRGGWVTRVLREEIDRCRTFAEQLRNPATKSNLCDSCNDWMRGGCSSTCNAYQDGSNSCSMDYSYSSIMTEGVRDEHK